MLKKEIRALYMNKRQELSAVLINELSQKIISTLLTNFDFNSKTVGVFLPIEKKREINLYPLLHQLNNARVCIPISNFDSHQMTFNRYVNFNALHFDNYGIPELNHATEELIPELLLIPLLISDERGYRVGYGKGFYDRYLTDKGIHCIKIGVSLFPPIQAISDCDEHDQKLDYLITPTKMYAYV